MIVADASVIVDLLLRRPGAERIVQRLFATEEHLHAPELLDLEVAQAVRRHASLGAITHGRGRVALDALAVAPIARYSHKLLMNRVWALRANFTAYDASYVALAEVLDATLVTRDARLAKSPGARTPIEVI